MAALAAGVLVAVTGYVAWKQKTPLRMRVPITIAVVLFPVQIVLGRTLVVDGSSFAGIVHLLLAMSIFAGLLVALTLALEVESSDVPDSAAGRIETPERVVDSPTAENSVDGDADGVWRTVRAYLALTKPRLMWLLCLVALAGMGLATLTGEPLVASTAVATLLGGVLAIGASGTFNHVYERDRDRRMNRTADRPLVHDIVSARNATLFGVALTVTSMTVLVRWVNVFAAALTLVAIVYYAVFYTVVLKPHTTWNTVIGGGAGALPALIGWVAVAGSVGLPAVVLAVVIFWWTPAHFYNLAIAYRDDYERGGFPMVPVAEGDLVARRHVVLFLGATLLSTSLLGWLAGLGWVYTTTSVVLGAVFLRSIVRQYRLPTDEMALRTFYVSNYYLGAILAAIVIETLVIAV